MREFDRLDPTRRENVQKQAREWYSTEIEFVQKHCGRSREAAEILAIAAVMRKRPKWLKKKDGGGVAYEDMLERQRGRTPIKKIATALPGAIHAPAKPTGGAGGAS